GSPAHRQMPTDPARRAPPSAPPSGRRAERIGELAARPGTHWRRAAAGRPAGPLTLAARRAGIARGAFPARRAEPYSVRPDEGAARGETPAPSPRPARDRRSVRRGPARALPG